MTTTPHQCSVTQADIAAAKSIIIRVKIGELTVEHLHETFARHRENAMTIQAAVQMVQDAGLFECDADFARVKEVLRARERAQGRVVE
ncbi:MULTISPECIES: hypothetical protein [unclassified Novosphingobium]|uniref:hypothetical protein n=1 Tax=unclassified Novosphingobium TaxID=2644732 RepID=UPI0013589C5F|nr:MULTISPECIES: hypothetical protein [unclassified Novosphingobium]